MEPLMSAEYIQSRSPSEDERRLIKWLVEQTNSGVSWHPALDHLTVTPMLDGGMGSLRLHPEKEIVCERKFGSKAAETEFLDSDGAPVIAALFLDQDGELFELDIFKSNFLPVVKIPSDFCAPSVGGDCQSSQ